MHVLLPKQDFFWHSQMRFDSHRLRDESQHRGVEKSEDTMKKVVSLMHGLKLKNNIRERLGMISAHFILPWK